MPKEPQFKFKNTADGRPMVQVYGYIGAGEAIQVQSFMSAFDAATAGHSEVVIEINCGGGSVIDGFAIIDLLRTRNKKITTRVVGLAASMGFVLMLAGDTIEIMPNARLMAHRVTVGAYGDADTIETLAQMCKDYEARIVAEVVRRTGMAEAEAQKWFVSGKDKWFTAQEALTAKLVDTIIETQKPLATPPENSSLTDIYNFYNKLLAAETEPNMKEIIKKLGLSENATPADILTAIGALQSETNVLRNELAAQEAAAIKNLLDAAVAEGKITDDLRPTFEAIAKENFSNAQKVLGAMDKKDAPAPPQGIVPQTRSLNDYINRDASAQPQNRATWTRSDWEKHDPDGLRTISEADYDAMMLRSGATPIKNA